MSDAPALPAPQQPLTDGELTLRPWRESDAEQVAAACSEAEIQRWIPVPSPYRLKDALEYIRARESDREQGRELAFAVVAAGDEDSVLGSIGIVRPSLRDRRVEIGYWVAAPARGRGVAARSVRLLCAWAIDELDLARVEIIAAVDNAASCAVAEAAGFEREAELSRYIVGPDGVYDAAVFALLVG